MSQRDDREAIVAALGHRTPIVAVRGPAGIGKTSLLEAALVDLQPRLVVRCAGAEAERTIALAGVDSLTRSLPRDTDRAELHRLLGDSHSNVELRVGRTLIEAFDALAAAGGVLVVDDAHWLDDSSRRAVAFALRRLGGDAPRTLIAERPDRGPLAEHATVVTATGMSYDEAQRMLRALLSGETLGDERIASAFRLHHGNPLAMLEQVAGADPSQPLGDRMVARVVELPERSRLAIGCLALAGTGDEVTAAWDEVGSGTLRDAFEPAVAAGLVDVGPPVRFHHPEHRSAAEQALAPADRMAIHRFFAAATDDPDRSAWHLAGSLSGPDREVADLLERAGQRAADRGLPIDAAQAFETSAELSTDDRQRADRLLLAASAWWYTSHADEVERVARTALQRPLDTERRARANTFLLWSNGWRSSVDRSIRGMLDDADLLDDLAPASAAAIRLAVVIDANLAAEIDLGFEVADRAVCAYESSRDVEESADELAFGLRAARGFTDLIRGERDPEAKGDRELLWALAAVPPSKYSTDALNLLQLVGYGHMVVEGWDDASSTFLALRTEAHGRGAVGITEFTDACLAELDRRRGRWATSMSRALADAAIDPARPSAGKSKQLAVRARLLASRGAPEGRDLAQQTIEEMDAVGARTVAAEARGALMTYSVAVGDHETAWRAGMWVEETMQRGGGLEPGTIWHDIDLLDAAMALGRLGDLDASIAWRRDHAARTGRRWSAAIVALADALGGRGPAARALATFGEFDAPFEAARARLLLIEAGHDAGDLDELRAGFLRLGAMPFAERVRRCGGRIAAPAAPHVVDALSPAELRVAVSVAAGATNAEAADELYLSVRTVEAHLRSIFRKLDVRNRVELATLVAAADVT